MKKFVTNTDDTVALVILDTEEVEKIGRYSIGLLKEQQDGLKSFNALSGRELYDGSAIEVAICKNKRGEPLLLMRLADAKGEGWIAVAPRIPADDEDGPVQP